MTKNKRRLFAFLFLIISTLLITAAIKLKTESDTKLDLARSLPYRGYSLDEYHAYKSAENLWPLLAFDKEFQKEKDSQKKMLEEYYSNSSAVTVFLKENTPSEKRDSLISQLQTLNNIKTVDLVTKDEAYTKYTELNKNDPLLLQLVTPEILPESIEVFVTEIPTVSQIKEIKNISESSNIADQVITPGLY